MTRKAQAAMEFLMTYGWAILVVLVAIGALAYFGVLKADKFLPEKCLIPASSGLFCDEFTTSSSTGTITLRIKNILTDAVNIESISLDSPSCATSAGGTIDADGVSDFSLSCSGGLAPQQKVKASITLTYSAGTSGLNKSTAGQLVTLIP